MRKIAYKLLCIVFICAAVFGSAYGADYTIDIHYQLGAAEDTDIRDGYGRFHGVDAIERAIKAANIQHKNDPNDNVTINIEEAATYEVTSPVVTESKKVQLVSRIGMEPILQLNTYGKKGRMLGYENTGTLKIGPDITVTVKDIEGGNFFRLGYKVVNGEKKWCFIDPLGNPFFSTGVNNVGYRGDKSMSGTFPYRDGLEAKYGKDNYMQEWFSSTQTRLNSWNFNTLGAWSKIHRSPTEDETVPVVADFDMPYVVMVDVAKNSYAHLTDDLYIDVFSKEFDDNLTYQVETQVKPFKDDPNLIGYYYVGEYDWAPIGITHEGIAVRDLFYEYFIRPKSQAGKQELIRFLKDFYSDNIERFKIDMGMLIITQSFPFPIPSIDMYPNIKSFDDLLNMNATDNLELAANNREEYLFIPPVRPEVENLLPGARDTFLAVKTIVDDIRYMRFDKLKDFRPDIYDSYIGLKNLYQSLENILDNVPQIKNLLAAVLDSNEVDQFMTLAHDLENRIFADLDRLAGEVSRIHKEIHSNKERMAGYKAGLIAAWIFNFPLAIKLTADIAAIESANAILNGDANDKNSIIGRIRELQHELDRVLGIDAFAKEIERAFAEFDNMLDYPDVREAWTRHVAETYFRKCYTKIKQVDKNHLILGCEFIPWCTPRVVLEELAKYTDVVSINHYNLALALPDSDPLRVIADQASKLFGVLPYNNLQQYYEITKRPLMITEFSFISDENFSGCPNKKNRPVPKAASQARRAEMFAEQANIYIDSNYIIGYHWFGYPDQPVDGRKRDQEDFNVGLVSLNDQVYTQLTDSMTIVNNRATDFTQHPIPITNKNEITIIGPK